ncbi:MAG: pyridoxamine 5'-phosphate oxidase family protein [Rhodobacteraceae bacterium]|nr:pyridoxamine 5'-phosphate oxidase family protein [Paracoccaceae bacterium]
MENIFDEVITTRAQLREIYDEPSDVVINKEIDYIDDICARFIAASSFIVVGTRGADDRLDLSPKGDPAGFVHIIDKKTLIIPDRPGNHRLDTFENVLVNNQVALFFVIAGNKDTLRVTGTAQIVRDKTLQDKLAINGRPPALLLAVTVENAFMHCSKCMVRSRLWQPDKWPDLTNVPSLAEGMVAHGALSLTRTEMQGLIDDDSEARLY